jgi:hypothetical protein
MKKKLIFYVFFILFFYNKQYGMQKFFSLNNNDTKKGFIAGFGCTVGGYYLLKKFKNKPSNSNSNKHDNLKEFLQQTNLATPTNQENNDLKEITMETILKKYQKKDQSSIDSNMLLLEGTTKDTFNQTANFVLKANGIAYGKYNNKIYELKNQADLENFYNFSKKQQEQEQQQIPKINLNQQQQQQQQQQIEFKQAQQQQNNQQEQKIGIQEKQQLSLNEILKEPPLIILYEKKSKYYEPIFTTDVMYEQHQGYGAFQLYLNKIQNDNNVFTKDSTHLLNVINHLNHQGRLADQTSVLFKNTKGAVFHVESHQPFHNVTQEPLYQDLIENPCQFNEEEKYVLEQRNKRYVYNPNTGKIENQDFLAQIRVDINQEIIKRRKELGFQDLEFWRPGNMCLILCLATASMINNKVTTPEAYENIKNQIFNSDLFRISCLDGLFDFCKLSTKDQIICDLAYPKYNSLKNHCDNKQKGTYIVNTGTHFVLIVDDKIAINPNSHTISDSSIQSVLTQSQLHKSLPFIKLDDYTINHLIKKKIEKYPEDPTEDQLNNGMTQADIDNLQNEQIQYNIVLKHHKKSNSNFINQQLPQISPESSECEIDYNRLNESKLGYSVNGQQKPIQNQKEYSEEEKNIVAEMMGRTLNGNLNNNDYILQINNKFTLTDYDLRTDLKNLSLDKNAYNKMKLIIKDIYDNNDKYKKYTLKEFENNIFRNIKPEPKNNQLQNNNKLELSLNNINVEAFLNQKQNFLQQEQQQQQQQQLTYNNSQQQINQQQYPQGYNTLPAYNINQNYQIQQQSSQQQFEFNQQQQQQQIYLQQQSPQGYNTLPAYNINQNYQIQQQSSQQQFEFNQQQQQQNQQLQKQQQNNNFCSNPLNNNTYPSLFQEYNKNDKNNNKK